MAEFKMKACMIDISRFRVPKTERMKMMLKNISETGYNTVFFNIEHVFRIPEHPRIGSESDGYDIMEFIELSDFAGRLGLSLVPLIQSFGHMFHILKWDEYDHLSETDSRWSVSVSDQTYELIDDLYMRASQAFSSEYIHIGGDEVYDMAGGRSAHLLQHISKDELFLNHILKLQEIAARYDRKIVLWGDMIDKNPEVMKKLGRDIIVCYWNYDFRDMPETYNNLDAKILVCPGTNTWKSFFPRYGYALKNFRIMKERADGLNAFGYMVTDWGDAGHIHPYTFTENLFRLAYNVFDGGDPASYHRDPGTDRLIKALDRVHYADYLNSDCVKNKPEYVTKLLFHDSVFSGKCFADQTELQLNILMERIDEAADASSGWKSDSEHGRDLRLFLDQTLLLKELVILHLAVRKGRPNSEISRMTEEYIVGLRRWFAAFMENWLLYSQPMGLYFHIHFIKRIEQELLDGHTASIGTPYGSIPKKNLYDDPEYLNLFSVGSPDALKTLWEKALL